LVPVRFSSGRVEPIPHDGSAMLKGLALAEALAVVPPATDRRGQARLLPLPG
jgi:molybdopterin molybdotransferase